MRFFIKPHTTVVVFVCPPEKFSVTDLLSNYPALPSEQLVSAGGLCCEFADGLSLHGIYSSIKNSEGYEEAKTNLANLVTGFVEQRENDKFHSSLNFFEKSGLLSNAKHEAHLRKLGIKKFGASLLMRLGPDLMLLLLERVHQKRRVSNLITAFSAAIAYIEQDLTLNAYHRVYKLHKKAGYPFSAEEISNVYSEFSNANLSSLGSYFACLEGDTYNFFRNIVLSVDLENTNNRNRAKEVGQCLALSDAEIGNLIDLASESNSQLSFNLSIAGVTLQQLTHDFFDNVSKAQQSTEYCIDNDPFVRIKATRRSAIQEVSSLSSLASLSIFRGPDVANAIAVLATPLALKLANQELHPRKSLKITQKVFQVKEALCKEK